MSVPCRVVTNGRLLARRSCRQHLLGQHRAHRVRDRVVHVQQIEFVELRDLSHARRQRQIVGRIFKQRIARDLDLVIMDVRFRSGQANGLRIGDEMNLVAAASQFQAQFGGDYSAAAVGRITGDADLHAPPGASPTISSTSTIISTIIGFAGAAGDAGGGGGELRCNSSFNLQSSMFSLCLAEKQFRFRTGNCPGDC